MDTLQYNHLVTVAIVRDATERTCQDQLDGKDPCVFVCSRCDHITDHPEDERPNYCPNCGAKVVEE